MQAPSVPVVGVNLREMRACHVYAERAWGSRRRMLVGILQRRHQSFLQPGTGQKTTQIYRYFIYFLFFLNWNILVIYIIYIYIYKRPFLCSKITQQMSNIIFYVTIHEPTSKNLKLQINLKKKPRDCSFWRRVRISCFYKRLFSSLPTWQYLSNLVLLSLLQAKAEKPFFSANHELDSLVGVVFELC